MRSRVMGPQPASEGQVLAELPQPFRLEWEQPVRALETAEFDEGPKVFDEHRVQGLGEVLLALDERRREEDLGRLGVQADSQGQE